jgi:hypothetical protein
MKLIRVIQLQLYLTLMSAPILIYWGLPVSLASPVGNIIFYPLLLIFLFVSSIIFFCQIFHIPHALCIYTLGKTSMLFHYFLDLGNSWWLMGFVKPPVYILILVPIATISIFCCKKTRGPYISIGCLLAISCIFGLYTKYLHQPSCCITHVPCNRGELAILYSHNQLTIIDPGVLGQRLSAPSWVEYTLVPMIIKSTGQTTITNLVVMQPSHITFEAVKTLYCTCNIKNIYMPFWKGPMTKGQKRSYAQLMDTLQKNDTKIIQFTHSTKIKINDELVSVIVGDQQITSGSIQYPAMVIEGTLCGAHINYRSYKLKQ